MGLPQNANLLIICLVFLVTSLILSHLININTGVIQGPMKSKDTAVTQERVLEALCWNQDRGQVQSLFYTPDLRQTSQRKALIGKQDRNNPGGLSKLLLEPTLL